MPKKAVDAVISSRAKDVASPSASTHAPSSTLRMSSAFTLLTAHRNVDKAVHAALLVGKRTTSPLMGGNGAVPLCEYDCATFE